MDHDESARDAHTVRGGPPSGGPVAVSLLVMSKAGVYTVHLPAKGAVTLGRGDECDVRLNDAKVSRVHAVIEVGDRLRVVDQGSTNGTQVAGRPLAAREAVDVVIGDMITVGNTVLVLQAAPRDNLPLRVWSKEGFVAMADELRERSSRDRKSFGLVQLRFDERLVLDALLSTKPKGGDEGTRGQALERVLREGLRAGDVVAAIGPGRYHVLLPDTDAERGVRIAEQLGTALQEEGLPCELGYAGYPRDGLTLGELETIAAGRLREAGERPPVSAAFDGGAMKKMAPVIERVAAGMINVLLLGETGVGKEVLAHTIHERSPRARQPCVTLNCAAVSETLLESELFGHEKGAFTGAAQAKQGLLEAANGGSVFLDEIGEMPLSLQAKLLRVIEQREVMRVGAVKPRQIDVRFISATNRDLEAEIERGRFRRDLYFRLNGIALTLPPLRERKDEIEPLAKTFVAMVSQQMNRPPPRISPQVIELLWRYPWPGNIRELRNMMERAVLLCAGDMIQIEHLPESKMRGPVIGLGAPTPGFSPGFPVDASTTFAEAKAQDVFAGVTQPPPPLSQGDEDERRRIVAALEQCAGNQTKAAQILGISRRTLVTRLKEYALPRPRKPM